MSELAIPEPIREHLRALVEQRWSGREEPAPIDRLPGAMSEGVVVRLVSGGPFGWMMSGRLDRIDGRVALEVLEDSRMSGPDHYRVWDDGTKEALPNEWTAYSTPPDCSPEERERILERFYAHNHAVQEQLHRRGFI